MKNCLEYYYGIQTNDIHHVKNQYKFKLDNYQYIFFEYNDEQGTIDDIYNFYLELTRSGIYCHQIVLNLENKVSTILEGRQYVLMKAYDNLDRIITINDVIYCNNITLERKKNRSSDWKQLWITKIDYFEYQISQFGNKHPLLKDSFSYFSGFVETAIQLLNIIDWKEVHYSLSHKRIKTVDTLFDIYNPFNLIIDCRVRDFCEYIKDAIFQKKNLSSMIDSEKLIYEYIDKMNLNFNEIRLFFIRMLYPSFYFDLFEESIVSDINDSDNIDLKNILEFSVSYEQFIKRLYNYFFIHNYLPLIEWLKNE